MTLAVDWVVKPQHKQTMYPFSRVFIVAMLQHRLLKTSKQIEMNLKCCENECNILIKPHWLSDTENISLETCKSDKQTSAARLFVYWICNSLENISCIWKSMWINICFWSLGTIYFIMRSLLEKTSKTYLVFLISKWVCSSPSYDVM